MPSPFKKLTPNLIVANVERSLAFGMCEFAIEDPGGYVITFAERQPG